jgi:hypothetical protein
MHTKGSLEKIAKQYEAMGRQFMSAGETREGLQCAMEANKARDKMDDAPARYFPPYMLRHCIKRGYNPERFADMWNGVQR